MKSIRLKILLGFCVSASVLIVFLGLVISLKLDDGIKNQSDIFVGKVTEDMHQELEGHLKMLEVLFGMMQEKVKFAAETVISNPSTNKNIEEFNVKPLKELLAGVAAETAVDFIHLYDKNGKIIAAYPEVQSETAAEQYIKMWPAGRKLLENIQEGILGEKANVYGYSEHGSDFFQTFGLDRQVSDSKGGISYVSLSVLSDFFDEPLGICIAGKMLNNITGPLERLKSMTKSRVLVFHGSREIAAAGFEQDLDESNTVLTLGDEAVKTVYASGEIIHLPAEFAGQTYMTVSKALRSVDDKPLGMLTVAMPESEILRAQHEIGEAAAQTRNDIQLWILLIGVVAIIIFFGVSLVFAAKIVNPILSVKEFSNRIAEGDLSHELDIRSTDELGSMTRSFNTMVRGLAKTITGIHDIAGALSNHAEGLLTETEELASGSREQDATTQQVAHAVGEMTQNISNVTQNAADAAAASKDVSTTAELGKEKVMETVSGMKNIAKTVDEMVSIVSELRENSSEIVNIVSLIDDIAEQTNLLALNAAIEAARAGEQGRGFSIVADEVRKLAERTSTATKEIHGMVKKIQSDTERSVKSMDSGRNEVEKGMNLVEEASAAMDSIVQYSEKCLDMIHQIASACEQQSSASDEISSSMEGIAKLTGVTMNSSERIENSSKQLRAVSEQLIHAASWFKMKTDMNPAHPGMVKTVRDPDVNRPASV